MAAIAASWAPCSHCTHRKAEDDGFAYGAIRVGDEGGDPVDVVEAEGVSQELGHMATRINVDGFDEALAQFPDRGFREARGLG